jgi:hypothetical protein
MTETKKRGPGRPPKKKRVITRPSTGQEIVFKQLTKEFMIACNRHDAEAVDEALASMLEIMYLLAGAGR